MHNSDRFTIWFHFSITENGEQYSEHNFLCTAFHDFSRTKPFLYITNTCPFNKKNQWPQNIQKSHKCPCTLLFCLVRTGQLPYEYHEIKLQLSDSLAHGPLVSVIFMTLRCYFHHAFHVAAMSVQVSTQWFINLLEPYKSLGSGATLY